MSAAEHSDAPFVLAHLSDPHLTSLHGVRARDLANKRVLGYLSWLRRRRRVHLTSVLDALMADVRAHAPDHIAITGDLTHVGLPSECAVAFDWLRSVGGADRVSLVPGNHDRYAAADASKTVGLWRDYARSDDGSIELPFVRRRGRIALIGVDSAVPTAPLLATGRVGAKQLARLADALDHARAEGLFRVVLLHHSPLLTGHSRRKRLDDAAAVTAVLERHGAELVVHGHGHEERIDRCDSATGPMPIVAVPSASDSGIGRAGWNCYRIDGSTDRWRLRIDARRSTSDGFATRAVEEFAWDAPVSRAAGSTSR
jgi:3',5'-cyclic AMP phosphodiesterase CpdA